MRSFQFNETGQYRMEDVEPIRRQLRTPGWSKIVSAQSKEETSEVYTRMEQGKVVGFAIIAAEPKELTVVAIEGTIDLNDLAELERAGDSFDSGSGAKDLPKIRAKRGNKNEDAFDCDIWPGDAWFGKRPDARFQSRRAGRQGQG